MKLFYLLACCALLASCGSEEKQIPLELLKDKPAQRDTSVHYAAPAEPEPAPAHLKGNRKVRSADFSECLSEYTIETQAYLRRSSVADGIGYFELGFWANCCTKKEMVAKLDGDTLTLAANESDDLCRCRCCFSSVVEVEGLAEMPKWVRFRGQNLIEPAQP